MLTLEASSYVAVIAASFAAICGVKIWYKQQKWQKRHDLAVSALTLFYRIEAELKTIRDASVCYVSERKPDQNESRAEKAALDHVNPVSQKYKQNISSFIRLNSMQHEFRALFGDGKEAPFLELLELVGNIPHYMRMHVMAAQEIHKALEMLQYIKGDEAEPYRRSYTIWSEKIKECEKVIYSWKSHDEEDDYANKVKATVSDLAEICAPYLKD